MMFYDQTMEHRLVSVTSKNCDEAGSSDAAGRGPDRLCGGG